MEMHLALFLTGILTIAKVSRCIETTQDTTILQSDQNGTASTSESHLTENYNISTLASNVATNSDGSSSTFSRTTAYAEKPMSITLAIPDYSEEDEMSSQMLETDGTTEHLPSLISDDVITGNGTSSVLESLGKVTEAWTRLEEAKSLTTLSTAGSDGRETSMESTTSSSKVVGSNMISSVPSMIGGDSTKHDDLESTTQKNEVPTLFGPSSSASELETVSKTGNTNTEIARNFTETAENSTEATTSSSATELKALPADAATNSSDDNGNDYDVSVASQTTLQQGKTSSTSLSDITEAEYSTLHSTSQVHLNSTVSEYTTGSTPKKEPIDEAKTVSPALEVIAQTTTDYLTEKSVATLTSFIPEEESNQTTDEFVSRIEQPLQLSTNEKPSDINVTNKGNTDDLEAPTSTNIAAVSSAMPFKEENKISSLLTPAMTTDDQSTTTTTVLLPFVNASQVEEVPMSSTILAADVVTDEVGNGTATIVTQATTLTVDEETQTMDFSTETATEAPDILMSTSIGKLALATRGGKENAIRQEWTDDYAYTSTVAIPMSMEATTVALNATSTASKTLLTEDSNVETTSTVITSGISTAEMVSTERSTQSSPIQEVSSGETFTTGDVLELTSNGGEKRESKMIPFSEVIISETQTTPTEEEETVDLTPSPTETEKVKTGETELTEGETGTTESETVKSDAEPESVQESTTSKEEEEETHLLFVETGMESEIATGAVSPTQDIMIDSDREMSKHHEDLVESEYTNAVTVIFTVPQFQQMDVFWYEERNRQFRDFVINAINVLEARGWNEMNNDYLNGEESSYNIEWVRKKRDYRLTLQADDLVYIAPSPMAENRQIYVAFFVRNGSTSDPIDVVPSYKIYHAINSSRVELEARMGLNISRITSGIILVRYMESFFVRHAIVFTALLAIAVFCICVIIVGLVYIRCKSLRGKWDRNEFGDKNKLNMDLRLSRDVGDLHSDHEIQNDESAQTASQKNGHACLNGNSMHVVALDDQDGWLVPMDETTPAATAATSAAPTPKEQHAEDTKL